MQSYVVLAGCGLHWLVIQATAERLNSHRHSLTPPSPSFTLLPHISLFHPLLLQHSPVFNFFNKKVFIFPLSLQHKLYGWIIYMDYIQYFVLFSFQLYYLKFHFQSKSSLSLSSFKCSLCGLGQTKSSGTSASWLTSKLFCSSEVFFWKPVFLL